MKSIILQVTDEVFEKLRKTTYENRISRSAFIRNAIMHEFEILDLESSKFMKQLKKDFKITS